MQGMRKVHNGLRIPEIVWLDHVHHEWGYNMPLHIIHMCLMASMALNSNLKEAINMSKMLKLHVL